MLETGSDPNKSLPPGEVLLNGGSGVEGPLLKGRSLRKRYKETKRKVETWGQNQGKEKSGGRGGAAPGASVVFETGDRDTKQESESPTSRWGGQ